MRTTDPYTSVSTRRTEQAQSADARQQRNHAGGYTFVLNDEARLRRFLVLGSDSPTYYAGRAELTRENASVVVSTAAADARGLTDLVCEISLAGRAPKQNPALLALAAAAALGDDEGRAYALAALPRVARTGTHLFLFARYVEQFRGWGRGLRRAVGRWYTERDVDALTYQLVKYRQREGWSHRDLLRLAHPPADSPARAAAFDWACGRTGTDRPALIEAFERAQQTTDPGEWVGLVESSDLSWEMLPDAALAEPAVWSALVERGLPMTALIRQLPRLTRLGVARSSRSRIVAQLTDPEQLRSARVHPVTVLVAQRTYAAGESARGSSTWTPERRIVDALDAAFYTSFGAIEPTGARTLLALDVSGSMSWGSVGGLPLTPREASAALALVTASTEPNCDIVGFTGGYALPASLDGLFGRLKGAPARLAQRYSLAELPISPRQRLDDAVRAVSDLPFGPTDCALPMTWAAAAGQSYDLFCVYTDNETWAGSIHPHQALADYRRTTGIDAKLVVVGMTSNSFSIADPSDPGMLDVVGFDAAVPQLIADFARGF